MALQRCFTACRRHAMPPWPAPSIPELCPCHGNPPKTYSRLAWTTRLRWPDRAEASLHLSSACSLAAAAAARLCLCARDGRRGWRLKPRLDPARDLEQGVSLTVIRGSTAVRGRKEGVQGRPVVPAQAPAGESPRRSDPDLITSWELSARRARRPASSDSASSSRRARPLLASGSC